MHRSFGIGFFVPLVASLIVQGCSRSSSGPRACATGEQCPSASRCLSGTCVANAAPVARIELPAGPLEASRLLVFDGASSADPDQASGDSVASRAWTFRAVAAPCAPPAVAGTGPNATVRFACPGTYAVDLAVTDEMGATGAVTREFAVAAYSGPALLEVSPDLALPHACSGGRCAPAGAVALSATPTADAPAGLAFEWSVEPPPDRPLGAGRRAAFDPGPDVASPTVLVETDGQAISGDWIFHVVARDAAGVVASGATRLSVGNRPPVVTGHVTAADHAFDGARFTAGGAVAFAVTDPDGDEFVGRTITPRHVSDGAGATFTVAEGAASLTYAISVPYAAPGDAGHLIGGAGLERSITLAVADVNGAGATETWPIEVPNRPPVLLSTPAPFTVDHVYSAISSRYEAQAPLSSWSDPDGDPLLAVPGSSTGDPICAEVTVANGVANVTCAVAFTGTPAAGAIAGPHAVAQHVMDPWVPAATAPTATFTVANRPPAIDTAAAVLVPSPCSVAGCCRWTTDPDTGARTCGTERMSYGPGSTTLTGRWTDPDGDPLAVALAGATQVCTPGACAFPVDYPTDTACGVPPATLTPATTASDGMATASGTFDIGPSCP